MYKHLLVPLDGSAQTEQVLPFAVHLAHTHHATLYLTLVNDLFNEAEACQLDLNKHLTTIMQRHLSLDEAYLTKLALKLQQQIEVRTIVTIGTPVPTLLEISQAYHCNLIILSRHYAQNSISQCLGQVIQKLLDTSITPIIIHDEVEITPNKLVEHYELSYT